MTNLIILVFTAGIGIALPIIGVVIAEWIHQNRRQ